MAYLSIKVVRAA